MGNILIYFFFFLNIFFFLRWELFPSLTFITLKVSKVGADTPQHLGASPCPVFSLPLRPQAQSEHWAKLGERLSLGLSVSQRASPGGSRWVSGTD